MLDAPAQWGRHVVPTSAEPLAQLYRHIGEVVLADVGNAYFIHPAAQVVHDLATSGPIRLGRHGSGAVFASDRGGIRFAADGTVHRSVAASRKATSTSSPAVSRAFSTDSGTPSSASSRRTCPDTYERIDDGDATGRSTSLDAHRGRAQVSPVVVRSRPPT